MKLYFNNLQSRVETLTVENLEKQSSCALRELCCFTCCRCCCPRCGTNKQTRAAAPLTPRQSRHPSPSSRQISAIFPNVAAIKGISPPCIVWHRSLSASGGRCRPVCFLRKGDLDGLGEGGKTTDCFIERSNPRLPPRPLLVCAALQRFGRCHKR